MPPDPAREHLSQPRALRARHEAERSHFRLAVDQAFRPSIIRGKIARDLRRCVRQERGRHGVPGALHDRDLAGIDPRPISASMSRPSRLSVLDQSIAVSGRPHDQSIRNTVALAQHCQALGYERVLVRASQPSAPSWARARDRDGGDRPFDRPHPHRQRRHHAAALLGVPRGRGLPRSRRAGARPHRHGPRPLRRDRRPYRLRPQSAANERPDDTTPMCPGLNRVGTPTNR